MVVSSNVSIVKGEPVVSSAVVASFGRVVPGENVETVAAKVVTLVVDRDVGANVDGNVDGKVVGCVDGGVDFKVDVAVAVAVTVLGMEGMAVGMDTDVGMVLVVAGVVMVLEAVALVDTVPNTSSSSMHSSLSPMVNFRAVAVIGVQSSVLSMY